MDTWECLHHLVLAAEQTTRNQRFLSLDLGSSHTHMYTIGAHEQIAFEHLPISKFERRFNGIAANDSTAKVDLDWLSVPCCRSC